MHVEALFACFIFFFCVRVCVYGALFHRSGLADQTRPHRSCGHCRLATTNATTAHFHMCHSASPVFTGGVMKRRGAEKDQTISSTEGKPSVLDLRHLFNP